jgi:hypothetical protein
VQLVGHPYQVARRDESRGGLTVAVRDHVNGPKRTTANNWKLRRVLGIDRVRPGWCRECECEGGDSKAADECALPFMVTPVSVSVGIVPACELNVRTRARRTFSTHY